MTGLIPRSGGELTVFGKPVSGPVTDVGIVFQQPILLEWRNVLENVLFQVEMRGLKPADYKTRALELLGRRRPCGFRGSPALRAFRRHAPARLDRARSCA